jgi:hypothetical protein
LAIEAQSFGSSAFVRVGINAAAAMTSTAAVIGNAKLAAATTPTLHATHADGETARREREDERERIAAAGRDVVAAPTTRPLAKRERMVDSGGVSISEDQSYDLCF